MEFCIPTRDVSTAHQAPAVEMGLKRSRFSVCNVIAFKDEGYVAGVLQSSDLSCCDCLYVVHLKMEAFEVSSGEAGRKLQCRDVVAAQDEDT